LWAYSAQRWLLQIQFPIFFHPTLVIMRQITVVLICLTCAVHARRTQTLSKRSNRRIIDSGAVKPSEAFASLLLASNPAATFSHAGLGAGAATRHPSFSKPRAVVKSFFGQEEKKEEKSVEEVTEKYGLEAGLFSAFRGGNKNNSMQQAGDLLKRYGGAYLLTSTSIAAVSFGICYYAVDNGLDIEGLLSKFGIEVSQTSTTAGTVGVAYAIHKAASPIRFPPTVALTPIVAKNVFGKNEEDVADAS